MTADGPAPAAAFDRFVRPRAADGALVAVLYEQTGTSFIEELGAATTGCPDDVRVLDVGGMVRSASQDAASEDPTSTAIVGNVEQIDDVATVERELTRFLEESGPNDGSSVLYVDSLTPLLRRVDAPLVGDFLEQVTRTLRRWDALGIVQVDAGRHDERTLSGLRHRVDATIDIASDGDDEEYSVVDPGAAAWLAAEAGPERPPVDVALDLLGTPERRAVLAYLSIAGTATHEDLAEYLARRADVPTSDPERLRIGLYQVHLPKLIQAGALARGEKDHRVELRPPGDALLTFLEVASAYELP